MVQLLQHFGKFLDLLLVHILTEGVRLGIVLFFVLGSLLSFFVEVFLLRFELSSGLGKLFYFLVFSFVGFLQFLVLFGDFGNLSFDGAEVLVQLLNLFLGLLFNLFLRRNSILRLLILLLCFLD